jgi:hypothetical protein
MEGDWSDVLLIWDATKFTDSSTLALDSRALGLSWLITLNGCKALAVLSATGMLSVFYENQSRNYDFSSIVVQAHDHGNNEMATRRGCVASAMGYIATAVGNVGWVWSVDSGTSESLVSMHAIRSNPLVQSLYECSILEIRPPGIPTFPSCRSCLKGHIFWSSSPGNDACS